MLLVSSCLAGNKVRYDGNAQLDVRIQKLVEQKKAITVCPEVLGGLSTPREPAEIIGGDGQDVLAGKAKVLTQSGVDVTDAFIKGAYETLNIAQQFGAAFVILKENSPSCGGSMIYDGTFQGQKVIGNGVTAALLKQNDIKVGSEKMHDHLLSELNEM